MKLKLNKSLLAPKADALASAQLKNLLLNSPFTVVINNYKSDFQSLNNLRLLVNNNNGFSYHPNKNVKIRAFTGFNTVLSPDVLNGLVIFAFFNNYYDLKSFFSSLELKSDLLTLSYFSLLGQGHVIKKKNLDFFSSNKMVLSSNCVYSIWNKIFFTPTNVLLQFPLNKIYYILNAYVKSTNKGT